MLDKQNMEPDEQFVDFAWGEMRKLLDEKMPIAKGIEEKGSKKFILLFLLFLGVILATSMLVLMNRGTEEPIQRISHLPIEMANVDLTQKNSPALAGQSQKPIENKSFEYQAFKPKATRTAVSKKGSIEKTQLADSQSYLNADIQVEMAQEPLSQPEELKEEPIVNLSSGSVLPIEMISNLDPEIYYSATSTDMPLLTDIKTKPLGFWSLEMQAMSRKSGKINGLGLNLLANIDLGDKGWQLSTGLGLLYEDRPIELYVFDGELYSFDYLTDNAELLAIDRNVIDTSNTDTEAVPITVNDLSISKLNISAATFYLNLPLRISKSIGNRWRVFLGGNVGYLLLADNAANASNSEEALGTTGSFVNNDVSYFQSNSRLKSTNSDFAPADLNQWLLAVEGGIQYRFAPKWELGLAYRHHLLGMMKDKEVKLGLAQLRLSVARRF
ncbi:MAG: hypothetical protein DHS20C18_22400 [Saprospiraceae bacterium]|nr:MAG: hypothetical protein DHS20C18_22400 [Saprospiraceae bacterium]